MNKTNNVVASTMDTSTLVRAKFGPGMLLQHEDLEQLNVYTRELSRLLFRSLFGCGVICGLVVKQPEVDHCNKVFVTVGAGLALDCAGDPVYVPKDKRFAIDENCYPDLPKDLWVVLCGTTRNCAPRTSMCTDDDTATSVCTRERDMFEIRVVSVPPKCACGCDESQYPTTIPTTGESADYCWCSDPKPSCYTGHYEGKCGCNCGDGSDCDCECILLARLEKTNNAKTPWTVDHRVRRLIRPVLMRDPQVMAEDKARKTSGDVLQEAPAYPAMEEIGTSTTKRQRRTTSQ
jgi:hypothetical protein